MAEVATFTFQVDEELKRAFGEATDARDETSEDVLRAFMRGYVEQQKAVTDYDMWFRSKVTKAIDAANAGEMLSGEAVEAEFSELRRNARKTTSR